MKISILVPAYEMFGYGAAFLSQSLQALEVQGFKDFEVIVGDQSSDAAVSDMCASWQDRLAIKYVDTRFCRGNPSANLNAAEVYADGEIVKLLFQDDFLSSPTTLGKIAKGFDAAPGRSWMVSGFEHSHDAVLSHRPFLPVMNERMRYGANTAGPPSMMAIRRRDYVPFNPDSSWLMDVAVYAEAMERLGPPIVLADIGVVSREWARQNTHEIAGARKRGEELAALDLPAMRTATVAAPLLHHAHSRLHHAMIDREHALLNRPLAPSDRRASAQRLSALSPTDRSALLETYFSRRSLMDAEWRRAATLLMSYYTSDADVADSVARDLRTLSRDSLGELAALQDYLDVGCMRQSYPTRLINIFPPAPLPDGGETFLSKLQKPLNLHLELAGRARSEVIAARYVSTLRDTLLGISAALAAAERGGSLRWRMGRNWNGSLDAVTDDEPAMIEVVVSSNRAVREALAAQAREDVLPFGFVVIVNPLGDGSVMPAPRARSDMIKPFVTVEQVFV